jgi:hypothetical protein
MLSFLGFGRRHKSTKRKGTKRKSTKKSVRRPPAKLIKLCKRYGVKATTKVGKKRVYKSVSELKKACLKKAMAMKKKMMKHMKKGKKSHSRRTASFSNMKDMLKARAKKALNDRLDKHLSFGQERLPMFGKRRRVARKGKCSNAAAMKAFKSFWKRHCAGARGARFGNGGNPALSASMGYEFCPDGMGGVLGDRSTGLFPSPCVSASSSAGSAFGKRRRKRSMVMRPRKRSMVMRPRRRSTEIGAHRRRRSTVIGAHRRRRSPTVMVRRRRRSD